MATLVLEQRLTDAMSAVSDPGLMKLDVAFSHLGCTSQSHSYLDAQQRLHPPEPCFVRDDHDLASLARTWPR